MKGTPPHWRVVDVNVGDLARLGDRRPRRCPTLDESTTVEEILAEHPELETKVNPERKADKVPTIGELVEVDPALDDEFQLDADDLAGWHLLVPSNPQRGEAQADRRRRARARRQEDLHGQRDYKVLEAYDIGGKENDYPVPTPCTAQPVRAGPSRSTSAAGITSQLVRDDVPHATRSTTPSCRCRP